MRGTFVVRSLLAPLLVALALSLGQVSSANEEHFELCNRILDAIHTSDPYHLTHPADDGFAKNLARARVLFEYAQTEAKNWKDYVAGKYQGQHVSKIQILGVRTLNEEIWNHGGTAELLEVNYMSNHRFLNSYPNRGHIINSNFRDLFIVNPLDSNSFQSDVINPTINIADSWLKLRETTSPTLAKRKKSGWEWKSWLQDHIIFSQGPSVQLAHFNTRQRQNSLGTPNEFQPLDYSQWRASATKRRETLVKQTHEAGLDWGETLFALHEMVSRNKGGPSQFTHWLAGRLHVSKTSDVQNLTSEFVLYLNDLNIGDFFPLPENEGIEKYPDFESLRLARALKPLGAPRTLWSLENRIALENGRNAHYLITTDVAALGFEARKAQDRWISRGASMMEMQDTYKNISENLNKLSRRIFTGIKKIIGKDKLLIIYQGGGDELTLFLPEIDANTKARVENFFASFNKISLVPSETQITTHYQLHYSPLVKVPIPGSFNSLVDTQRIAYLLMKAH
jgi:hypothetical protein